ncbi:hypothetical protein ACIBL3_25745 [Kribbella sp. NPDC050124]|uniref:hypothetical protein n=1 Tax=Kribbella sp. NPDC050124 TaxID=3364114 RepID=UPI003795647A
MRRHLTGAFGADLDPYNAQAHGRGAPAPNEREGSKIMREKTRKKILDRLDLEPDEDVRFVNIISAQPARRDSRVDGAMRVGKMLLSQRAGAKAEGFVVVTDRRVAVVDKNPFTMQPTNKVVADLPLENATAQYKRGTMPTVFVWMPDGNGLALTLGRLFAKQADELASVVGAERI